MWRLQKRSISWWLDWDRDWDYVESNRATWWLFCVKNLPYFSWPCFFHVLENKCHHAKKRSQVRSGRISIIPFGVVPGPVLGSTNDLISKQSKYTLFLYRVTLHRLILFLTWSDVTLLYLIWFGTIWFVSHRVVSLCCFCNNIFLSKNKLQENTTSCVILSWNYIFCFV